MTTSLPYGLPAVMVAIPPITTRHTFCILTRHSAVGFHTPLVIPMTPALAPTMSIQKSGACPVMPKMVVLRYFSCPARSMNVITLEEARHILSQSRAPDRCGKVMYKDDHFQERSILFTKFIPKFCIFKVF